MKKQLFIETYGCQMNFADSEIIVSILKSNHYELCEHYKSADLILVNTCSIREHAEQRVFNRLNEFKAYKRINKHLKIGVVGCMAERLKEKLLQNVPELDLVVGPDAYRTLPTLLSQVENGLKGVNVILSEEETYADIEPIRYDSNGISAFVSIMRGCQNFCAYCVVPYTRGKERSRDAKTILQEAEELYKKGYKEITLLGQNVNSYKNESADFPELLATIAAISPDLRVRFATSHPKDLSDKLLQTMQKYPNICKSIHLPVQHGSSEVLKKMNRKYSREWYLDRVAAIRTYLPDAGLSTDIIAGFCGETEEQHQETLSLMREIGFDFAFMFKYSEREGTYASKNYPDDIDESVKMRRLDEIIQTQQEIALISNQKDIGKTFEILVEGTSKKSSTRLFGRTSQNKVVVFETSETKPKKIGDYASICIKSCTAATLIGELV